MTICHSSQLLVRPAGDRRSFWNGLLATTTDDINFGFENACDIPTF